MEVSFLAAEGQAARPDAVVSVRAGQTRRQGTVQPGKKLRFPVKVQDAVPFTVGLLRHLGSGRAALHPEDGSYTVPVEPPLPEAKEGWGGGEGTAKPMQLRLRVTGRPLACGRSRLELKACRRGPLAVPGAVAEDETAAAPENTDADKDAEKVTDIVKAPSVEKIAAKKDASAEGAAAESRRYFEDHNIMRLIQALLEALVREQPDEPYEYIAAFMDRLSASRVRELRDALLNSPEALPGSRGRRMTADEILMTRNPDWFAAFHGHDVADGGGLSPEHFRRALRQVQPLLSEAQTCALVAGVAPGGQCLTFAAFCAAAEAAAGGEAVAAELAGTTTEEFAALAPPPPAHPPPPHAGPGGAAPDGAADGGAEQPPPLEVGRDAVGIGVARPGPAEKPDGNSVPAPPPSTPPPLPRLHNAEPPPEAGGLRPGLEEGQRPEAPPPQPPVAEPPAEAQPPIAGADAEYAESAPHAGRAACCRELQLLSARVEATEGLQAQLAELQRQVEHLTATADAREGPPPVPPSPLCVPRPGPPEPSTPYQGGRPCQGTADDSDDSRTRPMVTVAPPPGPRPPGRRPYPVEGGTAVAAVSPGGPVAHPLAEAQATNQWDEEVARLARGSSEMVCS